MNQTLPAPPNCLPFLNPSCARVLGRMVLFVYLAYVCLALAPVTVRADVPPQEAESITVTLLRVTGKIKDGEFNAEKEEPIRELKLPLSTSTNAQGEARKVAAEQIRQSFAVSDHCRVKVENRAHSAMYVHVYVKKSGGAFGTVLRPEVLYQGESRSSFIFPATTDVSFTIVASTQPIEFGLEIAGAATRSARTTSGARTLENVGAMFGLLGRYDIAMDLYAELLIRAEKKGDWEQHLAILNALGMASHSVSRYEDAIGYYHQALAIVDQQLRRSQEPAIKKSKAIILNNLGLIYGSLSRKEALGNYQQALSILREIKDSENEAVTLNNLGGTYLAANQGREARKSFELALALFRKQNNRVGQGKSLNGLGGIFATECQKALFETKHNRNTAGKPKGAMSPIMAPCAESIRLIEQALAIAREANDKGDEGFALMNLGNIYYILGQTRTSVANFQQALALFLEVGNRAAQGIALNNLMFGWQALRNPILAIINGKQAVNLHQQIRNEIRDLDKNFQKSFVAFREDTYRVLADLLISQGRLPEAEQVLAMLKEEEYFEFARRDAAELAKLTGRTDLSPEEQKAYEDYLRITTDLAKVESRQRELAAKLKSLPGGSRLSDSEQAELDRLTSDIDKETRAFEFFMERIKSDFRKSELVVSEIRQNRGLQSDLKEWGEGTVALYTVVGEERYRVILTTPNRQVDGKTEIRAAELNKKIQLFREVLQDPTRDPRPLGLDLYNILIKPIEKDLIGAEAKTLIWSLDGTLRYLPLAALYDGKQYLAEKYQQAIITLASRTRLNDPVTHNWRALGMGVSEKKPGFEALCAVPAELQSIVRSERAASDAKPPAQIEQGVLPGKILLNSEFSALAFSDALGRNYTVVHIASHFNFVPGDADKSFLLLGEGTLTLDDLRTKRAYDFTGVQLLTLSACETGVGTTGADGREIEGFGVVAQTRGAKAVLATLWSVADDSTRELMTNFYRIYSSTPDITKAEALRLAQLSLLNGDKGQDRNRNACGNRDEETKPKPSDTLEGDSAGGLASQPRFDTKKEKPYAHPFFWAPFILIGNWR